MIADVLLEAVYYWKQFKVKLIILMHHLKLFIAYSSSDKSSQPAMMSKPSIMQ